MGREKQKTSKNNSSKSVDEKESEYRPLVKDGGFTHTDNRTNHPYDVAQTLEDFFNNARDPNDF